MRKSVFRGYLISQNQIRLLGYTFLNFTCKLSQLTQNKLEIVVIEYKVN